MKCKFKIGDRVAYSAAFCRSIGALAGEIPHMRGKVTSMKPLGQRMLVYVLWDDEQDPKGVISGNLAKVGANRDFAHCD